LFLHLFLLYLLHPSSFHPLSFFIILLSLSLDSFSFLSYAPSLFLIILKFFISVSHSFFIVYSLLPLFLSLLSPLIHFLFSCSLFYSFYYLFLHLLLHFLLHLSSSHLSSSFSLFLLSVLLLRVFYSCVPLNFSPPSTV
jgi:hypothetical protein